MCSTVVVVENLELFLCQLEASKVKTEFGFVCSNNKLVQIIGKGVFVRFNVLLYLCNDTYL